MRISMPEISIIMSVYNGEAYLEETLKSIINQTYKNWELIAINDCSTDLTERILSEYAERDERIKVYANEVNLRLQASLNRAISLCSGKYIARMDADDICLPERLEKQYKFMEENPDIALSSCRFMTVKNGVYASGGAGGRCDSEAIKALLLVANPILHPGVIAKADVMKEFNYDIECTCTEDLELWTRLAMADLKMEILPECLLIYRLHDKQITETTLEKQHKEVVAIQKNYCGNLVGVMNPEQEEFYIKGIYFRENTDVGKFCEFYKWLKKENRKTKAFNEDALNYAMFEILAEYKRKGITKTKLIKAMLLFGIAYLLKEIPGRKKRAHIDGIKCIESAKKIGLKHSG